MTKPLLKAYLRDCNAQVITDNKGEYYKQSRRAKT